MKQQTSKEQTKMVKDVKRSTTVHNLLFFAHTLCIHYATKTFLLVSKQLLCFVHRQDQKREQKHTTKKFVAFHNHSALQTHLRNGGRTFK